MKIAVAGAGAVGCHFGSLLQQAGCEVVFLARGAHLQAIQAHGLKHTTLQWERVIPVQADSEASIISDADAVLLCCKMTGLEDMCRQLARFVHRSSVLVTLQNGVQAPDMVAQYFPLHNVIAGSAFIGARIQKPGHVIHSAAGFLKLGLWQCGGQEDIELQLDELLEQLDKAGVGAGKVNDIRALLWNKMLWNCGFNAITALTRRFAHDIATEKETAQMALTSMQEAAVLARSLGVALAEDAADKQLEITKSLGSVKTSMWQDLDQGRLTEIDSINGFVADKAKERGLDASLNRTLTVLIRAIEQGLQP